jgi:hypothetical protein
MLESYYENKLRTGVQKLGNGVRCLKFESPGFTGVPDRMILLPGGRVIFVETKQPGKKERKRQLYVQGLLRALGFEVFSAVNDLEKVEAVVARCREVLRDEGLLPA